MLSFLIFNTYMLLWSLFVSKAVFAVFLTLQVTEILLVIGNWNHSGSGFLKAGGVVGVITARRCLVRLGRRSDQRHGRTATSCSSASRSR